MQGQMYWWVHMSIHAAEKTILYGGKKVSVGHGIVQRFIRDGWEYAPKGYPGFLEKVMRGEEILWLQLPSSIDGVVLQESVPRIKTMLEHFPSVSIVEAKEKPFPAWSIPEGKVRHRETAA